MSKFKFSYEYDIPHSQSFCVEAASAAAARRLASEMLYRGQLGQLVGVACGSKRRQRVRFGSKVISEAAP